MHLPNPEVGFCAKIKALAGQGGRVPREWVICKENAKPVDRKSQREQEPEMADENEGLSELQKWILDQQKVEVEVDRDGEDVASLGDPVELIDGLEGLSPQVANTSNHQTKPPEEPGGYDPQAALMPKINHLWSQVAMTKSEE